MGLLHDNNYFSFPLKCLRRSETFLTLEPTCQYIPATLAQLFWCWGSRPKNQYIVQIMCWVLRDLMAPVHGNVKYVLRFYLRGSFDWSGQQGRRPIKVKQNSPHLTLPCCPSQVSRYPTRQLVLGHHELPCKYSLTLKSINIWKTVFPLKLNGMKLDAS